MTYQKTCLRVSAVLLTGLLGFVSFRWTQRSLEFYPHDIDSSWLRLSPSLRTKKENTLNTEWTVKYTSIDKDQWMNAVLKLHHRFNPQTLDRCNNTCVFKDWICNARTVANWEANRTSPQLKAVPLLPKEEFVFPWDKEYLKHKPLEDIKTLPNLANSRIFPLSKYVKSASNARNIVTKKNEELYFRVDLVDSYAKPRRHGGDEVRAWLSISKGSASLTGRVKDMANGSYLVMVTPKRPGLYQLRVTVTYPREAIRAAIHHRREGRYRFMYGQFRDGEVAEVTLCHTTPNIPGRPCICNLTTITKRPYYCGRPLDSRLKCKDWYGYMGTRGSIAKDYTPAEESMAATLSRHPKTALILQDWNIEVQDEGKPEDPLPTCAEVDLRVTWSKESPRGIWLDGVWHSFICKQPKWTTSWVTKCLRSTHVWMFGDSNAKMMYNELRDIGNSFQPIIYDWKDDVQGHNSSNNSTLTFHGHEQPNFHYSGFKPFLRDGGIEDYLARIPPTGDHIVIIHYFLHYAISDLSAIFRSLSAAKDAVSALLERNPKVLVGLRGPHTAAVGWTTNHIFGGDVLGPFILSIMDAVFRDLQDRVVFLDGWDMSISRENLTYHPNRAVPMAMLRMLLSLKCPSSL